MIAALKFFALIIFSTSLQSLIEMVASLLLVVIIVLYGVFSKNTSGIELGFRRDVNLLLLSVFMSMFMAYFFHYQGFGMSLFAQKTMYFLLFYYLLHYFQVERKFLLETVFWIGIVWCVIFLIQYYIFPRLILNSRVGLDRGTIRIFFPGDAFALIGYFYALHSCLTKKIEIKYLTLIVLFFIITGALQGTRSNMAALTLLTALFVLFYKGVKSRVLILLFSLVAAGAATLLLWNFFQNMISVSERQMAYNQYNEPIRKTAFRYFLTEFMPNKLCYIFGNGQGHPRTPLGQKMIYLAQEKKLYLVDIGFAGEYVRYGALFVLVELKIILGNVFRRLPRQVAFLSYAYAYMFFVNIIGAGALVSASRIVGFAIMFYLTDLAFHKEKQEKLAAKIT